MRFEAVVHVYASLKHDVFRSVVLALGVLKPVLVLAILELALKIAVHALHVAHQPNRCAISLSESLVELQQTSSHVLNVFVRDFSNLFDLLVLLFAEKVVWVAFIHCVVCLVEEVTHLFSRFLISFLCAFN
jgi:hypothetical protein